jgi:RimJ/RimL family protein N-acetyltransferase
MKEAVLALEKELFEHGLHRLSIRCDINNVNSSGVAKRSGYTLESVSKEAVYHYTGLHDLETYVKFSPYPITGF